jgi:protein TonB
MAYAARQTETQRFATIGVVLLIHVGIAALLVNEFAGGLVQIFTQPQLPTTFNVPPKTPPPQPQPTASPQPNRDTTVIADPLPPVIPPNKGADIATTTETGPTTGPTGLPPLDGGGETLPPLFKPTNPSPANAPSGWATSVDYPAASLRLDEHGTTQFRVSVGSDGLVKACEIVKSSGSRRLDDATCKLVSKRARFEPAKDKNGETTVGTYSNSVRWVLPD